MRPFCSSCIKQLHVPQRYGSASNMTRTRVNELPLRRQAIFRASSTSSVSSQAEDGEQCPSPRTWFLEKESTPSARSSTSETGHTIATRQPKFTTFDPSSTTPDQPSRPLTPLHPEATSPLLRGLYEHLTTSSGDVMPDSVVFLHTASSQKVLGNVAAGGELIGNTGGARWDWIIVAQVRGRGKGVIGRAERSLRKWVSLSSGQARYC